MKNQKLKRCLRQRRRSMIRKQGFWKWFQTTDLAELSLAILLSILVIGIVVCGISFAVSLIGGLTFCIVVGMILLITMSLWGPVVGELISSIFSRKRRLFILIGK